MSCTVKSCLFWLNYSEEHRELFNRLAGAAGEGHNVPEEVEVNNYGYKFQTENPFYGANLCTTSIIQNHKAIKHTDLPKVLKPL